MPARVLRVGRRRAMSAPRWLILGGVVIGLLSGCAGGSRQVSVSTSTASSFRIGDDVVVASATTVQLRTPEGRVVAPRGAGEAARFESRSGSITGHEGPPPGWPRDFPLPSGARPAGGMVMRSGGRLLMVARYTVEGRPAASVSSEMRRKLREQASEVDVVVEDRIAKHVITLAGRWVGAVEVIERGNASDVSVLLEFLDGSAEGGGGQGGGGQGGGGE
ncbi:MAG: hypothetical protein KatS3mg008_0289 [Acidimicrobiales bacterium]|nr:MAG: hypothetical protein KatS3mg008_0289 [Acidimicrobiales bacterium]